MYHNTHGHNTCPCGREQVCYVGRETFFGLDVFIRLSTICFLIKEIRVISESCNLIVITEQGFHI